MPAGVACYGLIAGKRDSMDGFGSTCVRRFVKDTHVLRDRSPEQWQPNVFGQVNALLRALRLRS